MQCTTIKGCTRPWSSAQWRGQQQRQPRWTVHRCARASKADLDSGAENWWWLALVLFICSNLSNHCHTTQPAPASPFIKQRLPPLSTCSFRVHCWSAYEFTVFNIFPKPPICSISPAWQWVSLTCLLLKSGHLLNLYSAADPFFKNDIDKEDSPLLPDYDDEQATIKEVSSV